MDICGGIWKTYVDSVTLLDVKMFRACKSEFWKAFTLWIGIQEIDRLYLPTTWSGYYCYPPEFLQLNYISPNRRNTNFFFSSGSIRMHNQLWKLLKVSNSGERSRILVVILFLPVELFTQAQDVRVRDSLKYFVCFLLIFTQKKAGIDYGERGK